MANTIYKVTISPYTVSGANQGGFIDPKSVTQYGLVDGLTFDQCKDKKRANVRWADIMEALSLPANPSFGTITATGATVASPATSFYFEVTYAAGGQPAILREGVMLTGVDAVKQMVAEALSFNAMEQCEVFDPTMTPELTSSLHDSGKIKSHLAVGPRFMVLDIGALAATVAAAKANITVTV